MTNIIELLKNNSYNGRGIVIGKSLDGKKLVCAYFIMGRSENSRNRVFEKEKNKLMIYPADEKKVEDPSLIIYPPVIEREDCIIVTNGDQTITIDEFLEKGKTFEEALETREFEPDAPNYTPRISGILYNDERYKMSILKSIEGLGTHCARYVYSYKLISGLGHFIHTYERDENPLPSFVGEPRAVEIDNDIDEFATKIWNNLNTDNKISLYVRYEDIDTKEVKEVIKNRFEKVD